MIKILKGSSKDLIELSAPEENCLINISNPSVSELEKFSADYDIPLDFLTDPLDLDERSRIESDNGTTLIILRIPSIPKDNPDIPYTTLPLGIIITKDFLITICVSDVFEVLDLFNGRIKTFTTENRNRFILHLFLRTSFFYLKFLKEINKRSNEVENELHRSMKNEQLIKLLNIEKSLVYFTTSLKTNELTLERSQKLKFLELSEEDSDLLEDTIIDNKQAIEMANIYSNILSGMMDAFASVISNNVNIVMKFLTSITIILMIPTLVASVYGMNVNLPFQDSPHAFMITMIISFILSITGVLIFLKKKLF